MAPRINQRLNNINFLLAAVLILFLFAGCDSRLVDSNREITDRKWTYRNHITVSFEVKDNTKKYNVYFKLRHTADYKYSNIFILAHFKGGYKENTKRYQYKLAKNDGEWLGSGSGNVFNYVLPLLSNYYFDKNGKFTIDIEQNMRDNPLLEISDVGILVEQVK
ncbi:gliding motility lipoprotein GldH [Pedobacter mucosus]|uniref:gliding motility lipoprotein GldH n=1 Tax=Pedobacter mucosus TaxID=2895286 RepID=UPI001EE4520A|nr:gliding motility lipoprotein GldH [Pedobacter mucosus]UKT63414.1 gliding motility lipoprotein GldH [Pedobacter mucosus]